MLREENDRMINYFLSDLLMIFSLPSCNLCTFILNMNAETMSKRAKRQRIELKLCVSTDKLNTYVMSCCLLKRNEDRKNSEKLKCTSDAMLKLAKMMMIMMAMIKVGIKKINFLIRFL